jgi:hypothetical protein
MIDYFKRTTSTNSYGITIKSDTESKPFQEAEFITVTHTPDGSEISELFIRTPQQHKTKANPIYYYGRIYAFSDPRRPLCIDYEYTPTEDILHNHDHGDKIESGNPPPVINRLLDATNLPATILLGEPDQIKAEYDQAGKLPKEKELLVTSTEELQQVGVRGWGINKSDNTTGIILKKPKTLSPQAKWENPCSYVTSADINDELTMMIVASNNHILGTLSERNGYNFFTKTTEAGQYRIYIDETTEPIGIPDNHVRQPAEDEIDYMGTEDLDSLFEPIRTEDFRDYENNKGKTMAGMWEKDKQQLGY